MRLEDVGDLIHAQSRAVVAQKLQPREDDTFSIPGEAISGAPFPSHKCYKQACKKLARVNHARILTQLAPASDSILAQRKGETFCLPSGRKLKSRLMICAWRNLIILVVEIPP